MILTRQIALATRDEVEYSIGRCGDDPLDGPWASEYLGWQFGDLGRAAYPVQARVNRVVQVIAFANTYA